MYKNIPNELKKMEQWVNYKLNEKGSKIPICSKTGLPAKSNDQSTWTTYEKAIEALNLNPTLSGLGFMFANGICGIDIDNCINNSKISPMALDIIQTIKSYTEISPSRTGIHILCKGKLPENGGRRCAELGLEMYDSGRYFTVTGNAYKDDDNIYSFSECTENITKIYKKYLPSKINNNNRQTISYHLDLSDDELLNKAFNSVNGYEIKQLYNGNFANFPSQSEADMALCNYLAFWFACDFTRIDKVFRQSGLMRDKWDRSVGKGLTYGNKTINTAISGCSKTYKTPTTNTINKSTIIDKGNAKIASNKDLITPDSKLYTFDDTGNGYRFRDRFYKDVKYNHIDGNWLYWDGKRWTTDTTGEIKRKADILLQEMQDEANKSEEISDIYNKHIKRSRSNKAKKAFIEEAQHMEGIPILTNELDRYINAINIQNGVINLKDGTLREHKRNYRMSLISNVTFESKAECPHWIKFLKDITNDDEALINYLQRLSGYCLTGQTKEQCIYMFYGSGRNGKSTFLNILSKILGEYAKNAQPETVMMRDKGSNGARSDIARLKGARLVTTFEPNEGSRFDEGMVKQMTGEDKITARFLFKAEFEFKPEFKIVMATNIKPIIRGTDVGIWRRIKLVPFTVKIPDEKVNVNLGEKLMSELPGIFNWMIKGAIDWYKFGMPHCEAIDGAISEYKTEMDKTQQFCNDCVLSEDGSTIQASVLYKVYKNWCDELGERYPMSNTKFALEMKKHFATKKTTMYNEYLNIKFNEKGQQLIINSSI